MGGFWKGGISNNRFVLKPDVAIASEVSLLSKSSLAIIYFHAKKTQHVQLFENPLPGTPPFAIPNRWRGKGSLRRREGGGGFSLKIPVIGFGKRGLLEKGSFQKSPFSRDSREFRDSRVFREPPICGNQRRIRPSSRDSREFRDFRDPRESSSEKTPFVMTPFSGPEVRGGGCGESEEGGGGLSIFFSGKLCILERDDFLRSML